MFTEFRGNCGNVIISLLRSNDKEEVSRGWDQSHNWHSLALEPGGDCFLFRPSDGMWWLLPGTWGLGVIINELFISGENVINVISPVLLNKLLTSVLNYILIGVKKAERGGWKDLFNINKINKMRILETPAFSFRTDPENTWCL